MPLFFANHKYEYRFLADKYGPQSSREFYLRILHSHPVQISLAFLLVLDVIALVVELVLDSEFPACSKIKEAAFCIDKQTQGGLLANEIEVVCHKHPESVETAHKILFGLSISILLVFEAELFATFALLGFVFFRQIMYVIDFAVVTLSLIFEIVFANTAEEGAGLLVFVRVWRFIRIGHGIFVDTETFEETKIQKLEKEIKRLKEMIPLSSQNLLQHGYT